MQAFSDLELDVLTELTNIGIGKAAAALSNLLGDEIVLTVPTCRITNRSATEKYITRETNGDLVGIKESFGGSLKGEGVLVFPKRESMDLVNGLIPENSDGNTLEEMKRDALVEIGNIVLNACIGTYANVLHQEMETTIPKIIKGSCTDLLGYNSVDKEMQRILMTNVKFSVSSRDVRGFVIFLMDLQSEEHFRDTLQDYLSKLHGNLSMAV